MIVMNKEKLMPLFEMVGEGGGASKTAESFDYTAIQALRATIAGEVENAVAALNGGTDIIETAFGATGGAMTGGSSNAIKNKWEELTATIKNFAAQLNSTLDNVKAVGVSNEALEAQAKQLFATTDNFAAGGGGGNAPIGGGTTAATYTNMVK